MTGEQTVTVIRVTTTRNDYGDETTSQTEVDVEGALFEPKQGVERTDTHTPGVVTPAKFYLPGAHELDSDDVILDANSVAWNIVANSSIWVDQTEVPVVKAGAV